MKILIGVISIIVLLWLAEIKITFNPFSISFGNYHLAIGFLMIYVGVGLIGVSFYNKGADDYHKFVMELLDEKIKKKGN